MVLVLDLDETLVYYDKKTDCVYERPGLQGFLRHASKSWKIVIFTAATKLYADLILDLVDPHKVISKRFYRDSCTYD